MNTFYKKSVKKSDEEMKVPMDKINIDKVMKISNQVLELLEQIMDGVTDNLVDSAKVWAESIYGTTKQRRDATNREIAAAEKKAMEEEIENQKAERLKEAQREASEKQGGARNKRTRNKRARNKRTRNKRTNLP